VATIGGTYHGECQRRLSLHLYEAPLVFPTYPYMIKYLLETYALDDELAQASIAVTNRKAGGKKLYISSK
jgi:hypothetical protein